MPDTGHVLAAVEEAQNYGPNLIRLREYGRSEPLSPTQLQVLTENLERLPDLGLRLEAEVDGSAFLRSGARVGALRFDGADASWLLVQVEPKIDGADLFSMLDRTYGDRGLRGDDVDLPVPQRSPSGVFLAFFAREVHRQLRRHAFRHYDVLEHSTRGSIRGRPRVGEFARRSLARGRPDVVPVREVIFTPNVAENQVIVQALHAAVQLVDLLQLGDQRDALQSHLRSALRLLPGVAPSRLTPRQIANLRYTRTTSWLRPLHELCRLLLEGRSIALEPSQRVRFAALSLDMPTLFERYVAAIGRAAWGEDFLSEKSKLTYSTGFGGRPIELDGLLTRRLQRTVVEMKYRHVPSEDEELVLGQVPERHIYQTVAYAGHADVRARSALIVYPSWVTDGQPSRLEGPFTDFGWVPQGRQHIRLWLLGIDLGKRFAELALHVREATANI